LHWRANPLFLFQYVCVKNEVKTRLLRRKYASTFVSFESVSLSNPENDNIDDLYALKTPSLQQVEWLQHPN